MTPHDTLGHPRRAAGVDDKEVVVAAGREVTSSGLLRGGVGVSNDVDAFDIADG